MTSLLKGLQLCVEQGHLNVFVESDSKILVDMIRGKSHWPWRYRKQLQEISSLMASSGSKLKHIFREANSAADWLAKQASSQRETYMIDAFTMSSFLKGLVQLDQHSFPYVRLRSK